MSDSFLDFLFANIAQFWAIINTHYIVNTDTVKLTIWQFWVSLWIVEILFALIFGGAADE